MLGSLGIFLNNCQWPVSLFPGSQHKSTEKKNYRLYRLYSLALLKPFQCPSSFPSSKRTSIRSSPHRFSRSALNARNHVSGVSRAKRHPPGVQTWNLKAMIRNTLLQKLNGANPQATWFLPHLSIFQTSQKAALGKHPPNGQNGLGSAGLRPAKRRRHSKWSHPTLEGWWCSVDMKTI